MTHKYGRLLLVPSLALLLAACGQSTVQAPSPDSAQRPWAAYLQSGNQVQAMEEGSIYNLAIRADWLANQPEMQEPEATELLYAYWQDGYFLAEAEASYYEPDSPVIPPNGAGPDAVYPVPDPLPDEPRPPNCPPEAIQCPVEPLSITPQSNPDVLPYIKSVAWGTVENYDHQYANQGFVNTLYPGMLDWSRDGCSTEIWGISFGLGYRDRFRPACNVHDFGYRNIPRYEYTSQNRRITDEVFLGNMRNICRHRPRWQRPFCRGAAYSYFIVVRNVGGGSWNP